MSFMSIYKHICCWDDSFYGDKLCIFHQNSAENITGGRKTVWIARQQGGVTGALLDLYYSASMSKNIAIFCLWFSTYRFRKLAFRLWFLKDLHIMHRINVCKTEAMLVDFQLNWSLMVPTLSPVRALQWRQEGSKSTWALSWMTNWPWTQTQEIWEGWEVSTDRSLLKNVLFMFDWATFNLCSKVLVWQPQTAQEKTQLWALYKTIGTNLNNLCHIYQVRGSQGAACLSARSSLHTVLTLALQKEAYSYWKGQIQSLFDIIALSAVGVLNKLYVASVYIPFRDSFLIFKIQCKRDLLLTNYVCLTCVIHWMILNWVNIHCKTDNKDYSILSGPHDSVQLANHLMTVTGHNTKVNTASLPGQTLWG